MVRRFIVQSKCISLYPSRYVDCRHEALRGVIFKQFTARDVVSRWDVIQAHSRATAQAATSSSTPCRTACPSLPTLCRSMAAPSSPPSSSKPASSVVSTCSCCRLAPPNSVAPSSAHPRRRVLPDHPLLAGDEKAQFANCASGRRSTTPCVPTSPWVTSPRSSSCCGLHLNQRNEKCHPSLDEYTQFDLMFISRYHQTAGWSSLVARWAHNPKVGGSNPPPATNGIIRLREILQGASAPISSH